VSHTLVLAHHKCVIMKSRQMLRPQAWQSLYLLNLTALSGWFGSTMGVRRPPRGSSFSMVQIRSADASVHLRQMLVEPLQSLTPTVSM
jgi:hypothetical protein